MTPKNLNESLDKSIEQELLKNDFAFYDDWEYGPISSWGGFDHCSLRLMVHDHGYWLILNQHASGNNKKTNLGSSNNAKDIIAVRDALKKLW